MFFSSVEHFLTGILYLLEASHQLTPMASPEQDSEQRQPLLCSCWMDLGGFPAGDFLLQGAGSVSAGMLLLTPSLGRPGVCFIHTLLTATCFDFAHLVNAKLSVQAALGSAGGRKKSTPEPFHTFKSSPSLAWPT